MSPVQKHFISMRRLNRVVLEQKSIIANNLSKAGWSWGCVSAIDSNGRTIWIADAQDGDGKCFVVRADEKLTAFCATWNRGLHSLVFGYIFYFLIVLIIVLCDLFYALREFCSVVAHEICGLECFGVFM